MTPQGRTLLEVLLYFTLWYEATSSLSKNSACFSHAAPLAYALSEAVFVLFASPLLFKECRASDPNKDPPCIIIKCFLCFLYYVILEEFRGFLPAHSGLWKKKVLSLQMAGTNDGMAGMRAHSVFLTVRFHLRLAT